MAYTIIVEDGPDGGWGGLVPDLPGLLLLGDSREEIIAPAPDAIFNDLDAMRDSGHPVPEPGRYAVEVAVATG
ncbi:MAG TPA: type II toxin-antitoxin system HicB family antitoxin [Xanthomonadales bacterium]|nr:type II toxin-antitoxin system HicB family antitoxin [Xanthomonadales bacterium]